jgi:hypothetical protein
MKIQQILMAAALLVTLASVESFGACNEDGGTFGGKKFCIPRLLETGDTQLMTMLARDAMNAHKCLLMESATKCFLLLEPGTDYKYKPSFSAVASSIIPLGERVRTFKFDPTPSNEAVEVKINSSFGAIQTEIDRKESQEVTTAPFKPR